MILLGEDGAPFFDHTRPVAFWINEKVWVNNHIHVLKPKPNVDSKFMVHWLNNVDYRTYINGSILNKLTQSNMNNIAFAFPSVSEQQCIANFLDAECARIDAIIEQTRASVEEYKKLKQSIITQAVTKGIRPNRRMKDSGIEWIGEIPDDWEIHKLCWDYSAELGKMLDAKRVTGEHLHPYIKNADVQWWRINALGLDEMDFSDDEYDRYTVKRGDLIICEGGEIGKCAVVPDDFPEGIYYQKALHRVRPRNRKLSNPYYLSYVIFCMAKQDAFGTTHEKATIQHLPGDALSQLRIPTPPYNEQCQIVSYISDEMARIDGLIQKKDQLLTEIDSYRKSLIYEYVTGKKEVL